MGQALGPRRKSPAKHRGNAKKRGAEGAAEKSWWGVTPGISGKILVGGDPGDFRKIRDLNAFIVLRQFIFH